MKKLLLAAILAAPSLCRAECQLIEFGNTSNVIRAKITSSSTGNGLTGLTFSSSGLRISTIADVESSATSYTVAGSTIETITTLGTYAAPTATKIRFKEVDATNHPGIYEFQIADARFAVSNAKNLLLSASGATGMMELDCNIPLVHPMSDLSSNFLGTTISELSAVPNSATPSVSNILRWLYEYGVGAFKKTCTNTGCTLYKADGSTTLGTCSKSDNGTTYTSSACS